MSSVELQGVDHCTSLSRYTWEQILCLAHKQGWEPDESGCIYVFGGRHFTMRLPAWSLPARDGAIRTADTESARLLAESLRTAVAKYRAGPPRWWKPRPGNPASAWYTLIRQAWEIIYLFGGGQVMVRILDDDQTS